jgi:hypothetical protein
MIDWILRIHLDVLFWLQRLIRGYDDVYFGYMNLPRIRKYRDELRLHGGHIPKEYNIDSWIRCVTRIVEMIDIEHDCGGAARKMLVRLSHKYLMLWIKHKNLILG